MAVGANGPLYLDLAQPPHNSNFPRFNSLAHNSSQAPFQRRCRSFGTSWGLLVYKNKLTGVVPPLPFAQYNGTTTNGCCLEFEGTPRCPATPTNTFTCPPPPTPNMCSCNSATGQCNLNPQGSLSPGECISTCKCVTPHNWGQLNGTAACGKILSGCNVCDACCFQGKLPQSVCDSCFSDPAGCGGKQ